MKRSAVRLPKYAIIDLSTGEVSDYPISEELYEKYIGGKALAARLLFDLIPPRVDPLSEHNTLIVNTGPMTGTGGPSTSRFNLSFKNVMTGGIASSNCGGSFGFRMKAAGYDGIIIQGVAARPSYIEILDGDIAIKDAEELWGMDTEEVQKQFDPHWGKLVIGPAGENLVHYACAVSDERVAGRCGAGAVMGVKKLKAIVAFGTKKPYVYDKEGFDAYNKQHIQLLREHPISGGSLPKYGSAFFLKNTNGSHSLPTKNFQKGQYEDAEMITGEALADTLLTRNSGCVSCPIRCERRVKLHNKEVKGPEYETLGLLGAGMLNNDLEFISELNYRADMYGLDTISLAGTLTYAMELKEKNLADFGVTFGSKEGLLEAVDDIAHGVGKGKELGLGSKLLSEKYGGAEFAIHSKGLELSAYEPRTSVGMGLGYATSNRGGCHLNGGYVTFMETVLLSVDPQTPKAKAEFAVLFQNTMEAVSAAGFCLFSAISVFPKALLEKGPADPLSRFVSKAALHVRGLLGSIWKHMPGMLPINSINVIPYSAPLKLVTGLPVTGGTFLQLGERCFNIEHLFNIREGFTAADDTLSARLLETPQDPDRPDTVVPLDQMLPRYYKIRGWDEDGVPTQKKLDQLGINLRT